MAEHENKDQEALRMLLGGPTAAAHVPPAGVDEAAKASYVERRMAQQEAYGQFEALSEIYVPGTGTLAFVTGAQVPIEHVEKWSLEDAGLVKRVASAKLARAGQRYAAETTEPAAPATDPVEPVVGAARQSRASGTSK